MRRTAELLRSLLSILITTAGQGIQFLWLAVSSRAELSAEVLFLRKPLAFYPGTPGSAPQAHRRSAVLLGALVSTIQLESGIADRQTGDPNRLAPPGLQAVVSLEIIPVKALPAHWSPSTTLVAANFHS